MKCRNTNASRTRKKQSPELFYKSRFSKKLCNIYRKSPVLESLLNKVAGLQACNFIHTSVFLRILRNIKTPILKVICVRLLLTRHTTFVFSFLKNVFYPNQTFLCLDFSLFSLRGFDDVLKKAFLNFFFTSMLY